MCRSPVPFKRKREWYDAVTAHWASHRGFAVAANRAWSKLYFNQKPGDPTSEMLVAVHNGKSMTYQAVSNAGKALWHAAKAKLAELGNTPITTGTPPWGAELEELADEPHYATLSIGEVASDTSRPSSRPSRSEVASDTSPGKTRRSASVAAPALQTPLRSDAKIAWQ